MSNQIRTLGTNFKANVAKIATPKIKIRFAMFCAAKVNLRQIKILKPNDWKQINYSQNYKVV